MSDMCKREESLQVKPSLLQSPQIVHLCKTNTRWKKMGDNKGYRATPITGDIPTNFKRSEKINRWLRAVCPGAHILSCLMMVLIAVRQQCFSAPDIVEDSHSFCPDCPSFCCLFKQVKSRWNQLILILSTSTHNAVFFHSLSASRPELQCIPSAKMRMDWCPWERVYRDMNGWLGVRGFFKAKWYRENWR